jgi:hypothetical protein
MKAGDFLNKMASKIEKQNDPGIIDLLSRADMQQIDIPDELANAMVSELMSLSGAKNNSSIKSHFIAEALNGVDTELVNTVNELGIDAEIFKDKKNTYDKIRILREKIKELQEQKGDAKGKEKAELQKQINDLNDKLGKTIESHKAEIGKLTQQYDDKMMEHLMFSSLQDKDYANRDMPKDVQVKLAKLLLTETLAKRGAKPVNDNGVLKLKRADDTGLEFFDENHKPVAYEDFVAKTLTDNKLLAVSDPTKGNNPLRTPFTVEPIKGDGEVNQKIIDSITAAMIPES